MSASDVLDAVAQIVDVGAHAGVAEPGERRGAPIVLEGAHLGELSVDVLDDQPLIERVASVISPYCDHPEAAS